MQVKSRHVLDDGKLHLLVRDHELSDPRVMIVAVVLDAAAAQLRDTAICVDVATYRRLAFRRGGSDSGYQASIPFPPAPESRWHDHAIPIAGLAQRLCPALPAAVMRRSPRPVDTSAVGNRAEARLIALLTADSRLNVLKGFPDSELAEYLVRRVDTGGAAALQVKAISVDARHSRGAVNVPPHTFHATPLTYFTLFAERREDHSLHPQCLLIPSMDMGDLLTAHAGELSLTWDPDSTRSDTRVAPYRCLTTEIADRVAALLA